MKKIIAFLTVLIMCITLSSCITSARAGVGGTYDDVDIDVVISYGTPYYNTEGLLLYYIYRDMYYYPYYYNNRYYFHRYYKPVPYNRYRPVPRDFYRHVDRRHYHITPHNNGNRHMRPNNHMRRSTTVPNRHMNGHRNRMNRPNNNGRRGFGGRR